MKRTTFRCLMVLALAAGLAGFASLVRAEDTNVFKNNGDVLRAQGILEADGYLKAGSYTPGQMDAATQKAVRDYQTSHSLNPRGILDDETFQMLTSHETSFPWDTPEPAAEPAELTSTPEPAAAAVAEAAPTAEPAPAAPAAEAAPAEAQAEPAPATPASDATPMPATASPLGLILLTGLGLVGAGALLLKQRGA